MDSRDPRLSAIEERIASRMPGPSWGAFPGAEIRKICPSDDDLDDLYTAVDLYLADIAGYTVNVRTIHKFQLANLLKMKERLPKSFYERYEGMERFRRLITPEATPNLYSHLDAAEMNRKDLLELVEIILAGRN